MSNIAKYLFVLTSIFLPVFVFASTGTISATNKYAWGDNIGWVNFNPVNGNVQVTDTALTGYIWSENYGWINLSPSANLPAGQSGVKNNGSGVLSGYAWGEGAGYINFSGVTIDSNGQFQGAATGDIVGTLAFTCATNTSCKVTTTWTSASPAPQGSGGLIISSPLPVTEGTSAPSTPPPTSITITPTTPPPATVIPTSILGCGNRTIGYSAISGVSCVGNIPTVPLNPTSVNAATPAISPTSTTAPSSSLSSGSTTYNFGTATLKLGSKGPAVKELQRFLNDTIHLGLALDGQLGPKTIAVIKKWQKDHKLVSDGLVGPKTKAGMLASVK